MPKSNPVVLASACAALGFGLLVAPARAGQILYVSYESAGTIERFTSGGVGSVFATVVYFLPEFVFSGSSSRMSGSWKRPAALGGLKKSARLKWIMIGLSFGAGAERAARRFRANIFCSSATGMRKRMRGSSSVGGIAQGFDDALAVSFLVFSIGPIGITTRASRMRREIVVLGIRTRLYLCRRAPVLAGSKAPA